VSWPLVSVGDLFVVHYGRSLKKEERDETGSHLVYGSSGCIGSHNDSVFDDETIVIGRKGSVGEVIWAPKGGWVIDTAFYLERKKRERIDLRYSYYALKKANLASRTITTSIPGLNRDDLYQTKIPLPPLEEQKRIAAILDKADAIRRKRQQAIKLADDFLRSVFLEMFGDPVTNPKGLKVVSLIELCEKVTDGTHQSPKWEGSGIPFLFISNIVDGKISYETSKYISESTYNLLTKSTPIETGDILYTTVGSYGNVALVREDNRFCFQRHIAHIKPNFKKVDPNFLSEMLSSSVVRKQADRLVKGVAQKTLNLKDLKGIKVFDVDFSGQNEFLEKSKKIIGFKNRSHHSLSNSELFFNALSQKAFSGQL